MGILKEIYRIATSSFKDSLIILAESHYPGRNSVLVVILKRKIRLHIPEAKPTIRLKKAVALCGATSSFPALRKLYLFFSSK